MSQSKVDPAVLEYIAEGKEIIERVSKNLSIIEKSQFDQETLALLYRDVHTLKGSSQLFGFKFMGQVSHAVEACLDPVRKGVMKLSPLVLSACNKNIDLLDRLLTSIEATGKEFIDETEVVKSVSALVEAALSSGGASYSTLKESFHLEEARMVQVQFSAGEVVVQQAGVHVSSSVDQKNEMTSAALAASGNGASNPASPPSAAVDTTVRVHVSLLDRILNLVGELVLVRNQLLQFRHKIDSADFQNTSKSLDVVTSDLQGEIMKTRMQPIETVVGKFQRVVRDISRDLGKKIDLTLEGSETELDKSMLEAIKDPLTHIVRNSCDHGIEPPDERLKANKPETGHLLIRSFHEGGQVVIEVSDDGRGLHRKKVLAKAIEKGLLTAEQGLKLSDREICELIFLPGFSTAQQVTAVSGRGVGMDVVKTNIEKIGGGVEIKSTEGRGTSIQLRIPLTLAIVPALIIKSHKETFAIPQVKLVELVHVEGTSDNSLRNSAHIEFLQGRPMYRLRGSLLPLYDLRDITKEKYDPTYKDGIFIVVLNNDGENFGLLVPEVLDTADIVVKPLSMILNSISTFSGATILGDGSIALIIDVNGVAEYGSVLNKRSQKDDREIFSKHERTRLVSDIQEFLLFSVGTDARHAVPLCLVNRLEEFSDDEIEQSGEQKVVRYRGNLLPLINLKSSLKYDTKNNHNENQNKRHCVVVIQRSGRNFGLVVDEIIDVLTIDAQIDDSIRDRRGILGNLLNNEEVIVVVDALGVIEDFSRRVSGHAVSNSTENKRDVMGELRDLNKEIKFKSIRVLYAEDVAFFRKHVSKVLSSAGIDIVTVEDGLKALNELDASEPDRYNLILSDIEMPNMTGLELAREVRKRERFKNIPMIALTTRYRESDIADGKNAGFNIYLEKLNPDKLMSAIQEIMGSHLNKTGALKENI